MSYDSRAGKRIIIFIICSIILLITLTYAQAASLNINGSVLTLGGSLEYDNIYITNGGILYINASNSTLNLTIDNIYVDNSSYIIGNGLIGYIGNGSDGLGDSCSGGAMATGGGGAGHAGIGGTGGGYDGVCDSNGGYRGGNYSSANNTQLVPGSKGGSGGSYSSAIGGTGGLGGGALGIYARTSIVINGQIQLKGSSGGSGSTSVSTSAAGGGGGGSGGTIILAAPSINISRATLDVRGGAGGNARVGADAENAAGGGGGGSAGRIKIVYYTLFENTSTTLVLTGGLKGDYDDGGNTQTNPTDAVDGSVGSYFLNQSSDAIINHYPTLSYNATVPAALDFGYSNVYINSSIIDVDNDSISGVYFSVRMPNGTILLNNVLGIRRSGNSSQAISEVWQSNNFSIANNTGSVGLWYYNISIITNASSAYQNKTYNTQFTLGDEFAPTVNLTSLSNNSIWYRNISIPISFTIYDTIGVDSCWYNIGSGNVSIPSCNNATFNNTPGVLNFTFYANDTSNNIQTIRVLNITLSADSTTPSGNIISPTGSYATKTFTASINATDIGGIQYCNVNITRGASIEVDNTQLTLNPSNNYYESSITVSGDADYIARFYCQDYASKSFTANGNFSVLNSGSVAGTDNGGAGGGAGGASNTIILNINETFTIAPKIVDTIYVVTKVGPTSFNYTLITNRILTSCSIDNDFKCIIYENKVVISKDYASKNVLTTYESASLTVTSSDSAITQSISVRVFNLLYYIPVDFGWGDTPFISYSVDGQMRGVIVLSMILLIIIGLGAAYLIFT